MRLFLAEKPSLARAIAEVLPGPKVRRDGHILCGSDDVVTWCAGHILELAPPDAYDPTYKSWRLDHLPIVPRAWKLDPSAPDLLKNIKRLLPGAARVVHAGDPDREGQLLVDEVLEFLGYRGPVDRLLISDLNPAAVQRALSQMQPNGRYRGLYEAGLARQRADWLYGINLTRLYTLLGRAGGYDGVLSVGRVQTPVLGLVVRRDQEIEAFQPRAYYTVRAGVRCVAGSFVATWLAPEAGGPEIDEAGRLLSVERASEIRRAVEGRPAVVVASSREKKAEAPPLLYSLSDLQIDAGRRFGLSPKQTLDAAQALYETRRLVTYPRSDCPFLPEAHHAQGGAVLAAVSANIPSLASHVGAADRTRRSRAWNDKKITAHHALVPTVVRASVAGLPVAERQVYELVARRYLAQFLPAFEFNETRIELDAGGERFRAAGRETLAAGWTTLGKPLPAEAEKDHEEGERDDAQALPLPREGDGATIERVSVVDRQTKPPRRFTEASLLQAMTGIARFVADPAIKKVLRETDGLGTPATQAQIIETLFERQFIGRRGRQLVSTNVGRALIDALPNAATRPDMTAVWEAAMRRIVEGKLALPAFTAVVIQQLSELVASGRARGALSVAGAIPALRTRPSRPPGPRSSRSSSARSARR
jgi:DNA topoisomerase-3